MFRRHGARSGGAPYVRQISRAKRQRRGRTRRFRRRGRKGMPDSEEERSGATQTILYLCRPPPRGSWRGSSRKNWLLIRRSVASSDKPKTEGMGQTPHDSRAQRPERDSNGMPCRNEREGRCACSLRLPHLCRRGSPCPRRESKASSKRKKWICVGFCFWDVFPGGLPHIFRNDSERAFKIKTRMFQMLFQMPSGLKAKKIPRIWAPTLRGIYNGVMTIV